MPRLPSAVLFDPVAISLGRTYVRRLLRIGLVREAPVNGPRLGSAADVSREFRALANLDREAFVVLHFDQKNRTTGLHVVSIGSLSASLVHPREVFKAAILSNAACILVMHNHPSGDPTPSREDREITTRLKSAGETLGIPLLDHVVIASDGYRSFSESGLL